MTPVVYAKSDPDGAKFDRIAPAGFRILSAIEHTARVVGFSLTITSGTDAHIPPDPHSLGEAYDIRSRTLAPAQKQRVLRELMLRLSEGELDAPVETSAGWATKNFFGFLEKPGTTQEHFHVQRRNGRIFP